jgi:hypothetical protein
MTVKIARLKSGEDIIAEIKEVYTKDEKLAAISLQDPYLVSIIHDPANMFHEGDEPFKTSNPKLGLYPWAPLSSERTIYIDPTELLCAYDPQQQVLEQYQKLLEAINHDGGNDGGGVIDDTLGPPDEINFTEASGQVSDWEGDGA